MKHDPFFVCFCNRTLTFSQSNDIYLNILIKNVSIFLWNILYIIFYGIFENKNPLTPFHKQFKDQLIIVTDLPFILPREPGNVYLVID